MICVVRHGAREDDRPRHRKAISDVSFDPALSRFGEIQPGGRFVRLSFIDELPIFFWLVVEFSSRIVFDS